MSPASEVPVQRQAGGWSDRNDSAFATFATADVDQSPGQVDVSDFDRDDFAGANRGLKHEADDGLVAEMVEAVVKPAVVGPAHARMSARSSSSVSGSTTGSSTFGCFDTQERVCRKSTDADLPGDEPPHRELSHSGGSRAAPASSSPAIQRLSEVRSIGSAPRAVHQVRYRWTPSL